LFIVNYFIEIPDASIWKTISIQLIQAFSTFSLGMFTAYFSRREFQKNKTLEISMNVSTPLYIEIDEILNNDFALQLHPSNFTNTWDSKIEKSIKELQASARVLGLVFPLEHWIRLGTCTPPPP
jgi:hypothetical protein